jgi:CelD/BcsL family acetyltransferase involved in cellulose biosynthesis
MNAARQSSGISKPAPAPITRCGQFAITLHDWLDHAVAAHWHAVLKAIRNPTLFQHIAWHQAFLDSRYDRNIHGRVVIAVAHWQEQAAAVVPLLIRKSRRYGLPVRLVELMFPTDMGVRDLPVADNIDAVELLRAVLYEALPAAGIRWDNAQFPDLVKGSTAFRVLDNLQCAGKLVAYHHDSNRLQCGATREQPFAYLSKSHIKKTRRKRKGLDELGAVTFELITEAESVLAALETYIELENAGWKGSRGKRTSLFHDQPQQAFYRSLMANQTPLLNPCVAILRLDGKPIAINLCTLTGETLWMLKITYTEALQDYSPGNLILLELLEHFAANQQVRYISFITGGEWTWRWGPERQPTMIYTTFRPTLAGIAVGTADKLIHMLKMLKQKRKKQEKESAIYE